MSLNWDVSKVENPWVERTGEDAISWCKSNECLPDVRWDDGSVERDVSLRQAQKYLGMPDVTVFVRYLDPMINAMIWMTLHTGIGPTINDKNVTEFYVRIKLIEKLNGAVYHKGDEPYFFTIDDVRRAMGLRVNVSQESRAAFVKRHVTDGFLREEMRRCERAS